MPWLGIKKLALVPVYRPNAHPPDVIPQNWPNLILERMLFFLDQQTRQDVSLHAYIRAASSGRADFDAIVQPMQTIDAQDVPPTALEAKLGPSLRAQGFNAAALVMLGGLGAGTSAGFWVRFVMLEQTGVWAMEFMHSLTGFGDLYPFGGNMGAFDEMACSCATHPSAYTKRAIQWIDASTVAHHRPRTGHYSLYSIGRKQPPPYGSVAAVQIGSNVPYLMVEARQKVDQFDANIPSEGVIVYQVETKDPLGNPQGQAPVMLLTPVALKPGQRYVSRSSQMSVTVTGATHNGFNVTIDTPLLPFEETQDSQTGETAMAPKKSPSYSFLMALKDAHGAEQPFGGFAEASGLPRKVTGLQKTTDVTLKRGTVSAKSLQDWIGSVRSGGLAIRKQVVLIQRDETGTAVGSWHLTGAYPTKWAGPSLGAKGNDVAIEELVLSPEGIEWIPPK